MDLKHLIRSTRWPRRLAYPIAGALLGGGFLGGFFTLSAWAAGREPTASWFRGQLADQPIPYGYLVLATLTMLALLGWLLGRKEDQLEELSVTDPLTGLANRRRLRAQFTEELNRAARYGTPLALLVVDVDRLKAINDGYGHAAGDRALHLVSEGLRRSCRATDVAARFGGDEFLVLAVNTTATEALALAHRIGATVRRLSAAAAPGGPRLTVSIGAADLERALQASFAALHAAADRALYQAKAEGRDRAAVAPPLPRSSPRAHPPRSEGGAGS
jgi:diguanylate cyclase (GGDEF)-like protein